MESLRKAPDAALVVVAESAAEQWTITRPAFINLLMAHFDVVVPGSEERHSFSITAWTEEELLQRIERMRRAAASLLDRRQWERENPPPAYTRKR